MRNNEKKQNDQGFQKHLSKADIPSGWWWWWCPFLRKKIRRWSQVTKQDVEICTKEKRKQEGSSIYRQRRRQEWEKQRGFAAKQQTKQKREWERSRASPVSLEWCCTGFDGPDADFARPTSSDGNSTGLPTTIDGPENLYFWRTRYSGVRISNGQEKISILRPPVRWLLLAKIFEIKFCFKLNAVDGVIVKNGRIRFFWDWWGTRTACGKFLLTRIETMDGYN